MAGEKFHVLGLERPPGSFLYVRRAPTGGLDIMRGSRGTPGTPAAERPAPVVAAHVDLEYPAGRLLYVDTAGDLAAIPPRKAKAAASPAPKKRRTPAGRRRPERRRRRPRCGCCCHRRTQGRVMQGEKISTLSATLSAPTSSTLTAT